MKARLEKHKKNKLAKKHLKDTEGGRLLEYREEDIPKETKSTEKERTKDKKEEVRTTSLLLLLNIPSTGGISRRWPGLRCSYHDGIFRIWNFQDQLKSIEDGTPESI